MANMVTLVPTRGIRLVREVNGQKTRVTPKIGVPFEFTAEEAKSLKQHNPGHVRNPRNEAPVYQPALPDGPTFKADPETAAVRDPIGSGKITPARGPVVTAARSASIDDL